jgi:calcium/calmodulin-dependent protein kinase (CaM kinase) II
MRTERPGGQRKNDVAAGSTRSGADSRAGGPRSAIEQELLELTARLLESIAGGDWETYEELCDPTLSAFEPEACGHLVEGLEFHRYYFDRPRSKSRANVTITSPHVRVIDQSSAVVSYVRLVQHENAAGQTVTSAFEETRVWQRRGDRWRHVHFHRSQNAAPG